MSRLLFSCLVAAALSVGTAAAQSAGSGRAYPTVTIKQSVLVDGTSLPAGTYEIRVTDERPDVKAGAPSDAQRVVELVQNNQVVARTIAEILPRDGREPVGTSGAPATAGTSPVRAELLRGGEFLRLSFTDAGARYLIHLPTGPLNEPEPQPQAPSRIVLPPAPAPGPAPAPQPQ
jgi:hypothetical protein